jgi:hypothetical protein
MCATTRLSSLCCTTETEDPGAFCQVVFYLRAYKSAFTVLYFEIKLDIICGYY